jgi:hypothetical protein
VCAGAGAGEGGGGGGARGRLKRAGEAGGGPARKDKAARLQSQSFSASLPPKTSSEILLGTRVSISPEAILGGAVSAAAPAHSPAKYASTRHLQGWLAAIDHETGAVFRVCLRLDRPPDWCASASLTPNTRTTRFMRRLPL